ncbi:MAG: cyclic nucleotide-binding domain-containing protein [Myxococcales bacterium]|nr:cyclic nucleotide-binding domain-containing protein [Myxococcales bacterium]
MDAFLHLANLLFLGSYLVRDILWLRVFSVVAMVALCPYYYSSGLLQPIGWSALFIGINFVQIYRLFRERRPVALDARSQRLHRLAFSALTPRAFHKLATAGRWSDVAAGERLIACGQQLDALRVIVSGEVAVQIDGATVAVLGDGRLVGEMSFLTGGAPSADVVAVTATSVLGWQRDELQRFLADNPEIRAGLQLVIGTDLACKLRGDR